MINSRLVQSISIRCCVMRRVWIEIEVEVVDQLTMIRLEAKSMFLGRGAENSNSSCRCRRMQMYKQANTQLPAFRIACSA